MVDYDESFITTRPPFGARAWAPMKDLISDVLRTRAIIVPIRRTQRGFEGFQVNFGEWRRCRVEHERNSVDAWRDLLEQFHHLAAIVGSILVKPVTLPPGAKSSRRSCCRLGRIDYENDGDGARLLQQRRRSGRVVPNNDVRLQRDKFLGESSHCFRVAGSRPGISIRMSPPSTT